jgi:hypothetical protein
MQLNEKWLVECDNLSMNLPLVLCPIDSYMHIHIMFGIIIIIKQLLDNLEETIISFFFSRKISSFLVIYESIKKIVLLWHWSGNK